MAKERPPTAATGNVDQGDTTMIGLIFSILSIMLTLFLGFIGFLAMRARKKRMQSALGRKVDKLEMNSISNWMEVAETEQK
jgi:hypothetical protein